MVLKHGAPFAEVLVAVLAALCRAAPHELFEPDRNFYQIAKSRHALGEMIRGDLLQGGRLGIVNLHGGLSPEYRGADCTFWALYNGEPEKVGCTLHYINAGIDTGALIAHVSPEVKPDDDELTLFWRAVQQSAAAYAELLRRLASGESCGVAQDHAGRLYQVKDRGLRHERRLAERLAGGLLRNLNLPARVRWFKRDLNA